MNNYKPILPGIVGGLVYIGLELLFSLKSEEPYSFSRAAVSLLFMGGLFAGLNYYSLYKKQKSEHDSDKDPKI